MNERISGEWRVRKPGATTFRFRRRYEPLDPEGVAAISRGLSEATPPGRDDDWRRPRQGSQRQRGLLRPFQGQEARTTGEIEKSFRRASLTGTSRVLVSPAPGTDRSVPQSSTKFPTTSFLRTYPLIVATGNDPKMLSCSHCPSSALSAFFTFGSSMCPSISAKKIYSFLPVFAGNDSIQVMFSLF